jgi:putative ABC transport system permease protein
MKNFKAWSINKGTYFASQDEAGAVIGAAVAKRFELQPGSSVTIRGEPIPVKATLNETGSRDDLTIFLPLPVAQRLFKVGERVSYVAVKVDNLALMESYIIKIKEEVSLGVVSDKQMVKSVLSIVGTVNITLQLIAAVAILAAAFGIINTMLMTTYERKREIGILHALGAKQRTIFTIFMIESGFYGLIGGVTGTVGGLLFSIIAAPYISQNAFTTFVKGAGTGNMLDFDVIFGSILFSAIVAVISGLYPSWRATRLSPVEAISYE